MLYRSIGKSKINTCFHVDVIFIVVCGSLPAAATPLTLSGGFLLSITAAATAGKLFRLCDRTCLPPPPTIFDGLLLLLVMSNENNSNGRNNTNNKRLRRTARTRALAATHTVFRVL